MEELEGVLWLANAQGKAGPYAKEQTVEEAKALLRQACANIQSGKGFDDGVRTVAFRSADLRVDKDQCHAEPEACEPDRRLQIWNGPKSKAKSTVVSRRVAEAKAAKAVDSARRQTAIKTLAAARLQELLAASTPAVGRQKSQGAPRRASVAPEAPKSPRKKARRAGPTDGPHLLRKFYDPVTLLEAYGGARGMVIGSLEELVTDDVAHFIDVQRFQLEAKDR
jgi:hypothetical protein